MGRGRKHRWTADQVPDLTGKVVVVTGANSGIGLETARELARGGAHTILACRSTERGQGAIGNLRAEMPDARVELMKLDLGSLSSIRDFALEFSRQPHPTSMCSSTTRASWPSRIHRPKTASRARWASTTWGISP